MRSAIVTFAAAVWLAAAPSYGQTGESYASADEVQSMIAAHKSGPLVSLGLYRARLGYPAAQAVAATQPQAELVYVVAGQGTLSVGGASRTLEKGVAYVVPANTAAQLTSADGLATISIRLPAGEAPADGKAKLFASAADFGALVAAGKNDPLVSLPPLRDMFQYRKEPQNALMHTQEDEFVYIADGSGTFTVGGTLIDPKPTTPGNSSGTGISGGTHYKVAPGAVILVPANTPHQFSGISGVLISIDLHLPHAD
jgi:quercetin dioxygenase-like cupin family protein